MKISSSLILAAMFACACPAQALIVYDTGSDTDNTYNEIADSNGNIYTANLPNNGSPWQYVAEVTNSDVSTDASAVYLGNDFLITAQHVNLGTSVLLDGTSYTINSSYTPTDIGPDLKLFQITTNPNLAPLPLIGASNNDLNTPSTMIGWGEGKGSAIVQSGSDVGWTWGGDSTRAERWGTNTTLSSYSNFVNGSTNVIILQTAFNPSLGPNTASASEGDSGSALFQYNNGTWMLAGIYDTVDTGGSSYYAGSPTNSSGMDYSYAIEIKQYSGTISAIVVPEPGSVALLGVGAVALAWCARRRRG